MKNIKRNDILSAMEINEINNVTPENLQTNSLDVVNYNPSDELDVGENNYDYGESLYAKRKRSSKIIKVVSTTLAIGATGLLGGSIIAGAVSSNDSGIQISNVGHKASDVLMMSYDIINPTEDKIYFIVFEDDVEVYSHDSFKEGHYEYNVVLDEGNYSAKFISEDSNNNVTTYNDYSFEFVIVK